MSNSKIVFFISGSIAAFKAAQAISKLVQSGAEVKCVATPSALRFVGAATFEGLTGHRVLSDLWEEGRAMDHIQLSRWADLGAVCPASANTLAKMALGLGDDAVSATLLTWPKEKSLHVFPAMNSEMYASSPVQGHMSALRDRGFIVHETGSGILACGEVGEGRLLEADEIVARLQKPADSRRRVLITGGATRENIDGVRFISNVSTGQTASELCDEFSRAGWLVTYVHGVLVRQPNLGAQAIPFQDFASLTQTLQDELSRQSYDAVIHCAAVSDYTVSAVNGQAPSDRVKLSSQDGLNLEMKPTSKILPLIREFSQNRGVRVIGFKLLVDATQEEQLAAARSLLGAEVDAVVANDWRTVASDRSKHPGFLVLPEKFTEFSTVSQLFRQLEDVL